MIPVMTLNLTLTSGYMSERSFIVKKQLFTIALILLPVTGILFMAAPIPPGAAGTAVPPLQPVIQLALLLDTSNSMDGLIDQARAQLWKIVNECIPMTRHGVRPLLQVALYEYGNNSLAAETGYIRMVLPFTDDLDSVSRELFALKTNGGLEYCGWTINDALNRLEWNTGKDALKMVFIAGNEPFSQGTVDYRAACRSAAEKGITVNTIFCGSHDEGIRTGWQEGARLADGSYMHIDQSVTPEHVEAPQDADIMRLGGLLNETYIPFGETGAAGRANQFEQDANAMEAAPGSMVQRSVAKSSSFYKSASWDLVDAVTDGNVQLGDIEKEDLPETMQTMTQEEREVFLREKQEQRMRIKEEIGKLNAERNEYVADVLKKRATHGENTLDAAMIESVRNQAVRKGYTIESQ
jgi:chorismate mutase